MLCWICELEIIDITIETSVMMYMMTTLKQGHLDQYLEFFILEIQE